LPGVTEEVFERIYETDFEHIVDREKRMLDVIDGATNVHISTPSGTDIRLALDLNRAWHRSATHVEPGEVRNLPTGEIFTAPLEDRAEGTIVIDAWHAIRTEDEAIVHVEEGKIVDWSDGAAPYVATLQEGGPNGVVIAELGIGSNAAHTEPIGNTLHDEKIAGTCHIAFGLNTSFGGENEADVHQDVVLEDPAITADGDDVPC
jgi:leucyl aminopeptidase (aminopeptidase T)